MKLCKAEQPNFDIPFLEFSSSIKMAAFGALSPG
jgi:hypothetical protein